MSQINQYFDLFLKDPSKEPEILADAALDLPSTELETLKTRINGKKTKDAEKTQKKQGGTDSDWSKVDDPKDKDKGNEDEDISQKALDQFWIELEKLDPASLMDEDVLNAFKYVGFDPSIVIKQLLIRGKKAGKDPNQIKKDLVTIVTIAILKGSITERNLQKTSDSGKVVYKTLKEAYGLIDNGAKGKDSSHVTVARVAAAVPGIVIQILVKRPEFAKIFIGPFGSKSLPPYLRHQASAACIPETASEKLKDFLLGVITAYTADQSKTLTKGSTKVKDTTSPEELFDTQMNFVITTHGSHYPGEDQRKKIFSSFSLSSDYEKIKSVAIRLKKIKTDFVVLSQQELDEELTKL
jgi:hypothetical protein